MKNFKNACLQPVLLALSLVAVCGSASAADNIIAVADKAGTFKTLLAAAKAAGLVHALQEDGPLTVFAPTDDAFAKLPAHTLTDLLKPENKEKLAKILKYHVISGKVAAKDAVQVGSAKTLAGDSVTIAIRDGRLAVNDATVIVNDVEASNGIIHVIDSVLMPPEPKNIIETAAAAGNFKTLLAAVEAAGLVETLQGDGPFTVLAPADEAFAELGKETLASLLETKNKRKLRSVLEYHLIPRRLSFDDIKDLTAIKTVQGAEVRVQEGNDPFADSDLLINKNNVFLISRDIDAANGIIHVIDSVLMPPEPKNIVETAAAAGNFKTLIAAVKASGLVETLQGEGPFTVLAPSDEAFGKLPHGTVESLLKPENKHKLQAILKYHVLSGRRTAQSLTPWSGTKAIDGNLIKITKKHPLTFNKSKVVKPDINASNGIIHVVDEVLMPPANSATKHIFDADSEFRLLQRFDPALESTLKSVGGSTTTATFCNLASKPIQVYWIDHHGKRKKWRGLIQPGALEICDRSYAGHVWLIADEHEKGLGLYILDNQNGLIVHK